MIVLSFRMEVLGPSRREPQNGIAGTIGTSTASTGWSVGGPRDPESTIDILSRAAIRHDLAIKPSQKNVNICGRERKVIISHSNLSKIINANS